MKVLVIDVGGTNVKILATGQTEPRHVPSGPKMSPAQMVEQVRTLAQGWDFDAVSIGFPGPVRHGAPSASRPTWAPAGSASTLPAPSANRSS
jgi:polyphosphate glucokinase